MRDRESDSLIVLSDGKAGHRGKGRAAWRSPYRKLRPDMQGWSNEANLTGENSRPEAFQATEASHVGEPGAGNLHAGICEGAVR